MREKSQAALAIAMFHGEMAKASSKHLRTAQPKSSLKVLDDPSYIMAASNKRDLCEKEDLQPTFDFFDVNGDGFITKEEFKTSFDSLGLEADDAKIDAFFRSIHVHKEGKKDISEGGGVEGHKEVDFDEFAKFASGNYHLAFGPDCGAKVSRNKFKAFLARLGVVMDNEELDKIVAEIDKEGDGIGADDVKSLR